MTHLFARAQRLNVREALLRAPRGARASTTDDIFWLPLERDREASRSIASVAHRRAAAARCGGGPGGALADAAHRRRPAAATGDPAAARSRHRAARDWTRGAIRLASNGGVRRRGRRGRRAGRDSRAGRVHRPLCSDRQRDRRPARPRRGARPGARASPASSAAATHGRGLPMVRDRQRRRRRRHRRGLSVGPSGVGQRSLAKWHSSARERHQADRGGQSSS